MTPPASGVLAPPAVASGDLADDEFVLDMRVIESLTPLVAMRCDSSDGCGSTCSTSACNTSSNDPF
jgi:FxLD family lantipeptide